MKLVKLFVFLSAVILMMSLLAACGFGEATQAPAGEATQADVQEPGTDEENTQPTDSGAGATDAEQPAKPSVPEDVPIMDGYRDFQATSDFTNISFIVDAEVADVVAWYQGELPNYGWEMSRAPDSALGSMANMSRINAEEDRLTISLQHNPVGEFTVVRIVVVRSP